MKKIVMCVAICFFLAVLVGCNNELAGETNLDGSPVFYDKREQDKSPFSDMVPDCQATFFIGELPEVNEPLSIVDIVRQDDACVYQGITYQKVAFPTYSAIWNCIWQLDCNYLNVLGKTDEGEIAYAIGDPAETLLIVNLENEPEWYITDVQNILNPCAYSVDDFDVEIIYGLSVRPNSISEIWEYHTKIEYSKLRDLLINSTDYQRYYFRCREKPWLVYELHCIYTYDGCLYIYNVPNDGMLLMNE